MVDTDTSKNTLIYTITGSIQSRYFYGGSYPSIQIDDGINSNILEVAPEYRETYTAVLTVMTSNVAYQTPDSRIVRSNIVITENNLPDIVVKNNVIDDVKADVSLKGNITYPFKDYIDYSITSVSQLTTHDTNYGSDTTAFETNDLIQDKTFKYSKNTYRNAEYAVDIRVNDPAFSKTATFRLNVVEEPAITYVGDSRDITITLDDDELVKTCNITSLIQFASGVLPIYTYVRDSNNIGIRSHDLGCNVVEIENGSTILYAYNEFRGGDGALQTDITVAIDGIEHSDLSFTVYVNEPSIDGYINNVSRHLGVFYNTVVPITNPLSYITDYPFKDDLDVITQTDVFLADDEDAEQQSIDILVQDRLLGTSSLMTVSLSWDVDDGSYIDDNNEDNSVIIWMKDGEKVEDDTTNQV